MKTKKKRRKVKVVSVKPFVAPDTHELTLHVEADEPPPIAEFPCELEDFPELPAKKRSFWGWLLGE